MNETRTIPLDEDPVCGMKVEIEEARTQGLTFTHEGREYGFCGKGCLLEFREDPDQYLDPAHQPAM